MSVVGYDLTGCRAALVAAHPDDETVGVGGCLPLLRSPVLIHITDGAPRDMRDAAANGFATREEYATARRRELGDALREGGVMPGELIALNYVDQEAAQNLVRLTRDLERLIQSLRVDCVLVHPYEGGHPDHDAAAFAVHAACRSLPPGWRPRIVEFASYHNRDGLMETGVFLPDGNARETVVQLDAETRARKSRMIACYRTQEPVLRQFGTAEERFRAAPRYDFSRPPHPGRLFYEQFPSGMTPERWVALARAAQEKLEPC
jgi:LmbE family N-acetylglucosaminyl deacetylase